MVVTTSNRAVATGLRASHGALVENLGILEEPAASALLAAKVHGAETSWLEERQIRTAVAACAGHPLALCLVGARLADDGPEWAPETLAALADERRRLEVMAVPDDLSVRAALDVSYRRLPSRVQELFRALGALPLPVFDAATAADALGSTDVESVQADLAQLAGESLLDRAAGRRYRMHGLVHARARELGDADAAAARERRVRAFAGAVSRAEGACAAVSGRFRYGTAPVPGDFADQAAALDFLAAERALLLTCVRLAGGLGCPDLACRAFQSLHELVQHRGVFDDVLNVTPVALDAAAQTGDALWSARTAYEAGFVRLERDSTEDRAAAVRHFVDALAWADQVSPPHHRTRSTALECLGNVARRNGDTPQARAYLHAAVDALGGDEHRRGRAILHLHIGRTHLDDGEHAEARAVFEAGIRLTQSLAAAPGRTARNGDPFNRAKLLAELARTELAAGARSRALATLTEAFARLTQHTSWAQAGDVAYYLAAVHRDGGEAAEAKSQAQEALRLFELAGSKRVTDARALLDSLA